MTTAKSGQPPTPEQVAAGGPPPTIEIISERKITTMPVPGEPLDQIAVTFRIPPSPPQVIFVQLALLPDWVFRLANPDREVPEAIQKQGDAALREIIDRRRAPARPKPRMI